MSDSTATENLVNEPQFLSKDSADRLFRVQNPGAQTADFLQHRDALAEIYETIHSLTSIAYDKGTLEFPDTADVYRAFTSNRRERGNRKPVPDMNEFRYLLAILAGQSSPLIHFVREINFDNGEFKIKTRYATPSSNKENAIRRAYQTSLIKSGLMIRGAIQAGATATNWSAVQTELKTVRQVTELTTPFKAERADLVLRNIFMRAPKDAGPEHQTHYQKINQELRSWLYVPLVKDLQKSGVLRVVSNNDLRGADPENFAKLPDCIYFNEAERIKARYTNLCLFLTTETLGRFGEISLFSEAHAARNDPPALFETSARLVADILTRIKTGGKNRPAPLEAEIFAEAVKLSEIIRKQIEKQAEEAEQKALAHIADGIREQANLVEIYRRGQRLRFEEKFLRRFLADQVPGMLIGTVPARQILGYGKNTPLEEFERVFALAKNTVATTAALDMALDIFSKSGDDFLLQLLDDLLDLDRTPEDTLRGYTSPVAILKFKAALQSGYVRKLPFWRRLWLMITGGEIDSREILEAKMQRLRETEARVQRNRESALAGKREGAKREIKDLARQNIKQAGSERETMQNMARYIDACWEKNSFPGRGTLRGETSLGSRFYIDRVLDGVDGGGAGYSDILRIPVQNDDGGIYITKNFLNQKGAAVKKLYDQKIDELIPILTGTKVDEIRKGAARRNQMLYSAIVKFIESRI